MNYFRRIVIFISVLVLGGCATGSHIYTSDGKCLTCWNNPITGEAINHKEAEKTTPNKKNTAIAVEKTKSKKIASKNKYCNKKVNYKLDVPVDVDLAYIRYKRGFGYMTKNEKIRARGLDPATANPLYTMMDSGFRHVVVPGVRYHMKESVDFDGEKNIGWLSLELESAGNKKTRIYVDYCEGGIDGFEMRYSKIIRQKLNTDYL